MRNPYEVLGVARDASDGDIKRAYRKLAKELHPDLNPGNTAVEQRFKEVAQAYGILRDADKRKRFDRGEIDASGQETPFRGGSYRRYAETGQGAKYSPFDFGEDYGVEDIFADLFGGGARKGRKGQKGRTVRRRGADVSYTVTVGFLEAAVGAKKRLRLADGKTLEVALPAGAEEGQTLRLKGQGMAGLGGAPAGDAYIEVHIEAHRFFTRKDNNVHLELPVTLQEAVMGAGIEAPTVHGPVSVKIPPSSNTGTTLRLKGKGVVDRKTGQKGDQYMKLKVVLPDKPDEELSGFVRRWSESHAYDPRRKAGMTQKGDG
ncbi:MAG: J domain-containing protein [Rhodospirillales bacterium]|nr:J domain-containing protein [Rhodospirillales bacterium]MDH3793332.1 J domain-containing protein [Rhodospirillales bacterium]MDH3911145.1 J domain-containing protein [Rhodospirillales bacterium]MDH3918611.1 J domain-containing protein [Rhodospirillales bacterium]MDH3966861.1 J domain-containing protein [Rhodospirillales bacterium]